MSQKAALKLAVLASFIFDAGDHSCGLQRHIRVASDNSMLAYALTLFVSAFLLFLVQPLIGRYILPWYGGSPSVWTTCMLCFQGLLLGGYAYAHFISSRFRPGRQAWVHACLLLSCVIFLPITPSDAWKPTGMDNPTWGVLSLLLRSVGLPFFVLSATGPLLQSWLGVSHSGRKPYILYSLSNTGSLLALLAYPFVVEPWLGRLQQTWSWSLGFLVFMGLCGFCCLRLRRFSGSEVAKGQKGSSAAKLRGREPFWKLSLWIILPACASAMLLATTNVLCQDLAVVPFLWVLPLALYLLTFILCFAGDWGYSRVVFGPLLIVGSFAAWWVLYAGAEASLEKQVCVYASLLFIVCMVCHGELYQLRPNSEKLTSYYLSMSLGGCLGGLFVAVGAPLLFTSHAEWTWSLGTCFALFAVLCLVGEKHKSETFWRVLSVVLILGAVAGILGVSILISECQNVDFTSKNLIGYSARLGLAITNQYPLFLLYFALLGGWVVWRQLIKSRRFWHLSCCAILICILPLSIFLTAGEHLRKRDGIVEQKRGFYGILTVQHYIPKDTEHGALLLAHGRITHGLQFLDPKRIDEAATYYSERSGVAHLLRDTEGKGPRHIGIVGLGAGTLASYGKSGDSIRFYEINPEVVDLAKRRFSFLSRSKASLSIVLGDARLSLEREPRQDFDILILDAFSGDAIPVHLLTSEAVELYLKHLKSDGVLALHISNRFLDLEPVVNCLEKHHGLTSVMVSHYNHPSNTCDFGSIWIMLAKRPEALNLATLRADAFVSGTPVREVREWTDDYTSILPLVR